MLTVLLRVERTIESYDKLATLSIVLHLDLRVCVEGLCRLCHSSSWLKVDDYCDVLCGVVNQKWLQRDEGKTSQVPLTADRRPQGGRGPRFDSAHIYV